ncbi:MAG: hypothetical protein ACR2NP_16535 [Pirellulaceae bacterium]
MSKTSYLSYCRLAWFSNPACERKLFRQMMRRKPQRVLEIGIGLGVRTLRIFDVARRYCEDGQLQYTGIDLFESRPVSAAMLTLKDAYALFRQPGTKVRLIPGDVLAAMTRTANTLAATDLIVIDAEVADADLQEAWRYFPRMMTDKTLLLRQRSGERGKFFDTLTLTDIRKLAAASDPEQVKAA